MLIAHLSDLHFNGTARIRERVTRVVDHIASLDPAPEVVLVTGDIANKGRPEEYDEAVDVFERLAGHTVLVVPGNHDRRPPMRWFLGRAVSDEPITAVVRRGGVTFVLADSTVPGEDYGYLAEDSRIAIEAEAATPGPLVVVLHHPPVRVGDAGIDAIRLIEPDRLVTPLLDRTDLTVVLCGHVHSAVAAQIGHVAVRIAPGVESAMRLPAERHLDALKVDTDPGLALHHLDDDGLVTHVRVLTGGPVRSGAASTGESITSG